MTLNDFFLLTAEDALRRSFFFSSFIPRIIVIIISIIIFIDSLINDVSVMFISGGEVVGPP